MSPASDADAGGASVAGWPGGLEAEQVRYYRARAAEYDADVYGSPEARRMMDTVLAAVPLGGALLELACGTGVWTQRLIERACTVTAVDAAPEMIDIARVRAPQATFVSGDLFSWEPPRRFDTIFFGFWLSHVPARRFDAFWRGLAAALVEGGRVVFVDEHVAQRDHETWLADEVAQRWLHDGSTYRIVKTYLDPERLTERLGVIGWRADVRALGSSWVMGQAHPSTTSRH